MTVNKKGRCNLAILDFENLFINNLELDQISSYLKRFNPIKTMGMQHMEIRHSAILGWLLDPQESHGTGDQFLKAFLAGALREGIGEHNALRALEISQADMMDAEVRREWRSIDLLVISRTNGWIFIIENKFHSKEHGNQLNRYYQKVENAFGNNHKAQNQSLETHGIFLVLRDDVVPKDPRYATIQYKEVLLLLKQMVDNQVRPLSIEVKIFIQHYIEVIEEASDMDETKNNMIGLARQLYRDHKKVINFIVEYGAANDFSFACDAVFGADLEYCDEITIDGQKYIYNDKGSNLISFLPKSWYTAFGDEDFHWHGCDYWWAGYPVICWLELVEESNNDTTLRLYAEVGPLIEYDFRKALIEEIISAAKSKELKNVSFRGDCLNKRSKNSKFLKGNSIRIEDVNDSEEISAAMKNLLKDFQPTFSALAEPMSKFIHYGKQDEYDTESKS